MLLIQQSLELNNISSTIAVMRPTIRPDTQICATYTIRVTYHVFFNDQIGKFGAYEITFPWLPVAYCVIKTPYPLPIVVEGLAILVISRVIVEEYKFRTL